jgi:hypothetical protein
VKQHGNVGVSFGSRKHPIQCLIARFGQTLEFGVVIVGHESPTPNMKRGSVAFWRKETNIIFALFSLAEDHCHALPYLNLLVYGEERCGEEGGEGGGYIYAVRLGAR